MGDGCGLLLTASSADGRCIMGAAGLGERGRSAEDVGQSAAQELVEDLQSGGCVDRWYEALSDLIYVWNGEVHGNE